GIAITIQSRCVDGRDDISELYRRYLWIALDGLRPERTGTSRLPIPPLTTQQTHTLLGAEPEPNTGRPRVCNLIALRIRERSKYAEPVSTTYKISTSTSRWIRWWPSQACPGRENPHWRWVCFTPKDHAATSKHYPPTPGAVWGKLLAPMLTKSVTSRQL